LHILWASLNQRTYGPKRPGKVPRCPAFRGVVLDEPIAYGPAR
jgi:hypothetical protein